MKLLSLLTAAALTGQSERTLRRRIADGTLTRLPDENGSNRTMIPFEEVKSQICVALDDDTIGMIERADSGEAEAQSDLGLLLLANHQPARAVYWFELAAKQEYCDAMHWLGRSYIEGNGVTMNEDLGMMWLSRAAASGHLISQEQMKAIRNAVAERQAGHSRA